MVNILTRRRTITPGVTAGLISKIEKPQALQEINDNMCLSDVVMSSCGDLGVEIPHEDFSARHEELIRACRRAVKPAVATQMLVPKVNAAARTSAEASDIATAIYDGADAVMLSAGSATGHYPVEDVAMMDRIIRNVEGHKLYHSIVAVLEPGEEETTPHAVATATADLAGAVRTVAIVAYKASGTTAARVACERPTSPIRTLTPNIGTSRQLSLLWGAHSVPMEHIDSYEEIIFEDLPSRAKRELYQASRHHSD